LHKQAIRKVLLSSTVMNTISRQRWLKNAFLRRELWYINRRTVAAAALIGLFVAMIPLPLQMLIAASAALLFGANLPISVVLVWLSNPITVLPISWLSLCTGCWLLKKDIHAYEQLLYQPWQWDTLATLLGMAWLPLLAGSLVIGLLLGLSGYYLTHFFWRAYTLQRWQERKIDRAVNKR
jgi:hypothetical protein